MINNEISSSATTPTDPKWPDSTGPSKGNMLGKRHADDGPRSDEKDPFDIRPKKPKRAASKKDADDSGVLTGICDRVKPYDEHGKHEERPSDSSIFGLRPQPVPAYTPPELPRTKPTLFSPDNLPPIPVDSKPTLKPVAKSSKPVPQQAPTREAPKGEKPTARRPIPAPIRTPSPESCSSDEAPPPSPAKSTRLRTRVFHTDDDGTTTTTTSTSDHEGEGEEYNGQEMTRSEATCSGSEDGIGGTSAAAAAGADTGAQILALLTAVEARVDRVAAAVLDQQMVNVAQVDKVMRMMGDTAGIVTRGFQTAGERIGKLERQVAEQSGTGGGGGIGVGVGGGDGDGEDGSDGSWLTAEYVEGLGGELEDLGEELEEIKDRLKGEWAAARKRVGKIDSKLRTQEKDIEKLRQRVSRAEYDIACHTAEISNVQHSLYRTLGS